jgi:uncharacterized protein (DUF1015 family)
MLRITAKSPKAILAGLSAPRQRRGALAVAKIKAFRALVYNQQKFSDLSRLVCPPYDVISPARQQYFHDLDTYNFIHILLGKDIPAEDKYKRAGGLFRDWIKAGVFIQEEQPAFYFYVQEFNLRGEKKARMGLIGLLHLGEDGASAFGHEHTRLEAKEDRLRLVKQVKANLSPIFALFQDKKRIIPYIYEHYIKDREPFIQVGDDEKTTHRLWRLTDPGLIADIEEKISREGIFIADGHHRFEVSLAYREAMRKKLGQLSGEEPFNYLLTYFTNTHSQGLAILPIHRLVKVAQDFNREDFIRKLKEDFDVEPVKDKAKFFFLLEKGGRTEHLLGMCADKKFWLVRLKNVKILDNLLKDKPREYRSLDVSILNQLILKKILGFELGEKDKITFSPHQEELIAKVAADNSYIAFFLNPVKVEQIISLALKGEKMPPKSTYFYPKVLSGLLINKLNV